MSIRESGGRPPREKWPLQLDLEGVPRDRETRELHLKKLKEEQAALALEILRRAETEEP